MSIASASASGASLFLGMIPGSLDEVKKRNVKSCEEDLGSSEERVNVEYKERDKLCFITKIVSKREPIIIREWNRGELFAIMKAIRMEKVRAGAPIIAVVRRSENASGPKTSLPPQQNV